jgi:hypothetical protein
MPIPKPNGAEAEDVYIGRCISEIASEYDAEGQAYAVCKAEYDKGNMSKQPSFEEMMEAIKAVRNFTV